MQQMLKHTFRTKNSYTFDLHLAIIGLENQFLVFFLSGCLRQVLLYITNIFISDLQLLQDRCSSGIYISIHAPNKGGTRRNDETYQSIRAPV